MPVINHRFYGQFFLVFPKIGYWNQHLCLQLAQRRVWFTLCSLHKLAAAVVFDVVVRTNAQGVWRSVGGPDQCRHHATCDRVTMRNLENRCTIALAWVEWTERRDCEKQQQNQRLNLQYNFCMMSWNLSTLFVCWWTDLVLLCADLYVFSSSSVFRARRRLFFFLLYFSVDQVIISAIFGTVSNDI